MNVFQLLVVGIFIFIGPTNVVSGSHFFKCEKVDFCKRLRNTKNFNFTLDVDSMNFVDGWKVEAVIIELNNKLTFHLDLDVLMDKTFRIKIRQLHDKSTYEVPNVLMDLRKSFWTHFSMGDNTFDFGSAESIYIKGQVNPFQLDFHPTSTSNPVLSINSENFLAYEIEENKEAVGLDFLFHQTQHVYGIPERPEHLSLRDTTVNGSDPYRLYNVDNNNYRPWQTAGLYTTIPFIIGHSADQTTGIFWLNSAETWVDIKKSNETVQTHWMSESGIIDVFVMFGPRPANVAIQYAKLTGKTSLPPRFSLGYHQSRWNYDNESDVRNVVKGFEDHSIPLDAIWLDIEHTDEKKYFTWDQDKFPNPKQMIDDLAAKGYKMVTIVDPHIKVDPDYWIDHDCLKYDLLVKDKDGKVFEADCWPGKSHYADFLNPNTRKYYADQYLLSNYNGSTLDLFTWNDMNEPSVFNDSTEMTMPKDNIHFGGWRHKDVHNIYGHHFAMATHEGHLRRSDNKQRPFILSRSAFAGTQRYAAVWTGDNTAKWEYLEASIPMCLSMGLAGISFCGSDVGGFFGDPDGQLLTRWYQAAAFQPFFRSHSEMNTKRREPWLFGEPYTTRIRQAIRWRYALLPYWYTVFYNCETTGYPVMRPTFFEFPNDVETFDLELQYFVGHVLLVRPIITNMSETYVRVYLPKGNPEVLWYDYFTGLLQVPSGGWQNVSIMEDRIPVYQRGGSILVVTDVDDIMLTSSKDMENKHLIYIIAPNINNKAHGQMFTDDGISFAYKFGKKTILHLHYHNNTFTSVVKNNSYPIRCYLKEVIIRGFLHTPTNIIFKSQLESQKLTWTLSSNGLTVKIPHQFPFATNMWSFVIET